MWAYSRARVRRRLEAGFLEMGKIRQRQHEDLFRSAPKTKIAIRRGADAGGLLGPDQAMDDGIRWASQGPKMVRLLLLRRHLENGLDHQPPQFEERRQCSAVIVGGRLNSHHVDERFKPCSTALTSMLALYRHRRSEAVILSTGTPIPARWTCRRRCRCRADIEHAARHTAQRSTWRAVQPAARSPQ